MLQAYKIKQIISDFGPSVCLISMNSWRHLFYPGAEGLKLSQDGAEGDASRYKTFQHSAES